MRVEFQKLINCEAYLPNVRILIPTVWVSGNNRKFYPWVAIGIQFFKWSVGIRVYLRNKGV